MRSSQHKWLFAVIECLKHALQALYYGSVLLAGPISPAGLHPKGHSPQGRHVESRHNTSNEKIGLEDNGIRENLHGPVGARSGSGRVSNTRCLYVQSTHGHKHTQIGTKPLRLGGHRNKINEGPRRFEMSDYTSNIIHLRGLPG